jgi:GWxTD domain-containing protein
MRTTGIVGISEPGRFLTRPGLALTISILFFLTGAAGSFAQKNPKLPNSFRDWLERDVTYIITRDEREQFLQLTTDDARDQFIERFWQVRNPDPGSATNSYREEIYRRIAVANARFGVGSGAEGWRSDRGRTYITLGEPQQKQVYRNSANLYPIEIWFYANVNPSLPRAFYVMFYQREGSGDYRFYSPYTDGPDKLVTGVEAINSVSAALRVIRTSTGPEVARISLSLLSDEPVDPNGRPSLESDLLLSEIKGLANLPQNRADIAQRYSLRENVKSRLLLEGNNLDVVTFPVHDSRGLARLDYAIRLRHPTNLAVTDEQDGRYRYSAEVRVIVFTADNKPVFTQQKTVTDILSKKDLDRFKEKSFGYLGTLPLPPGAYRLDIQFTDWSAKNAYHTTREVTIPRAPQQGQIVPAILPFTSAEQVDPGLADLTPFALAGVKFTPAFTAAPTLSPGSSLQVMYQIWAQPQNPQTYSGRVLEVEYALGKPAAAGGIVRLKDELPMEQFDLAGNMVNGKKLPLEQQTTGNYVLTLSLNERGNNQRVFATTNFRVLDGGASPEPADILEPGLAEEAETGIFDQQRAQCHLALGQTNDARVWFRRALQLNHANDLARSRLVDAYFSQKDYAAVVSLYKDAGITDSTDSPTILRIAESLRQKGDTPAAIAMLEKVLDARPHENALYLALAQSYRESGNGAKATEVARKAQAVVAQ